ncbi:MAG TPA: hypothetical protein VGY66_35300, partial [Gemmataceae bacterium]|nr:hypothetical protein [Gemmataceae bacterium]
MWLKQLSKRWLPCWATGTESSKPRRQAAPRRYRQLTVEQLEDRMVPSNFTAATVSDLIADINAANLASGSNSITLVAGNTFSLTAVDNITDGATGLPVIAANDNLIILGNGDTIARSTAAGTPAFRLFDVEAGAALDLFGLTLQNGLASGVGDSAWGGAIYSAGTLTLSFVTVQNNTAQGLNGTAGTDDTSANNPTGGAGGNGQDAFGGGLYIAGGTVNLLTDAFLGNNAQGGNGGDGGTAGMNTATNKITSSSGAGGNAGNAGSAYGGALYLVQGTVTVEGGKIDGNSAQGGAGGSGGNAGADGGSAVGGVGGSAGSAYGGALYLAHGIVTVEGSEVDGNSAQGGAGGSGGSTVGDGGSATSGNGANGGKGIGGALEVAAGTVTLSDGALSSNSARGGHGGTGGIALESGSAAATSGDGADGGSASGGALYVGQLGTVTLSNEYLNGNSAQGGSAGSGGIDEGMIDPNKSLGGGTGGSAGSGGAAYGGALYVTERSVLSGTTLT